MNETFKSDIVIIGAGLSGIVAAIELLSLGFKVLILERDTREKLGGLAKESFGGVMMVDTPHQKKTGIRDNPELALADWLSVADFDDQDILPRQWAELYVNTSREMIHDWLVDRHVRFMPVVNWPERGLFTPGNSVPRWHIAWGTGFKLTEAVIAHLRNHPKAGNLIIKFDRRVETFLMTAGRLSGCSGQHEKTGRLFEAHASIIITACGGICGGDLTKVRQNWYKPWGRPPETLLNGSHRFADGRLHDETARIGGAITHLDKQWHYAAGIRHPNPRMENQGLSLVPPRSALWLNALGKRIGPVPLVSYTDTRFLVKTILSQPGQYSWQVMNRKIAARELGVSGSEYMTAFRYERKLKLLRDILFGNHELVDRLIDESDDFIVADSIGELAQKMKQKAGEYTVDPDLLAREINRYDAMIARGRPFHNDYQLQRIAEFRRYRGDRIRTCRFQKINDKKALPLIAIREFILSRKSLGGIQTDTNCHVLNHDGEIIPGLYAVGEAAGFGGGGIHGKGSLEGTFLGSCVLTARRAAQAIGKGI